MTGRHLSCISLALSGTLIFGCAPAQFTTMTIFDTPTAFVRLEAESVDPEREHTHPISFTPDQMAVVLSGITVEEPWAKLPIYDDTSQPHRHPAFTEKEVTFFSPLLAVALSKATPEEVVTFYQSRYLSGTSREVTSGGLFVQGEELHIILANYRSPTHYSADMGIADTGDDRLTPMRSLAPQRGRLDFEPASATRPPDMSIFGKLFHWDRREVVILFKDLPRRSSPSSEASQPVPR